jgi:hypothetical protein
MLWIEGTGAKKVRRSTFILVVELPGRSRLRYQVVGKVATMSLAMIM